MKKSTGSYSAKMQPLFDKVGQLSRLQRILIGVVIFVLLIGGFAYFSIKPQFDEISKVEKKLADTEKELEIAKKKASALNALREEWKKKEEEFRIVMTALPDKQQIPTLLGEVSSAGRNSGLTFYRFAPLGEVIHDFYAEIPVAISISGTYDRLKLFFSKVAEMSRVVNIKNMTMSLDSKKGRNKEINASGDVRVECSAVTYRFLSEDEQKVKKQSSQKATTKGKKKKK